MTASRSPEFSFPLPQDLDGLGADGLTALVRRVEELGFSALWTADGGLGRAVNQRTKLDPIPALAFTAAVTTTIGLGVSVIVAGRRNPIQLAKDAASLAVLSRGRFVLGLGVGNDAPDSVDVGFVVDHRGARLDEELELLRTLWREPRTTFHGRFTTLDGLDLQPKPPSGTVPIFLGGSKPPALRRAARLADGWFGAGSAPLAAFGPQSQQLTADLEQAGRDPTSFPRARRVYVAVEDDEATARERLTPLLDGMYAWPGLTEASGLAGTPEQIAEGLSALVAAGATELLLNPMYDVPEQLERLAEIRALVTA